MSDPAPSKELPLAVEFAATDSEDWLKLVRAALKDRPFERLTSKTYDGLTIQPLYDRAEATPVVAGRAAAQPWQIIQRVDHPDPKAANTEALHDLANGATGLSLVFAGSPAARGFGLVADGADALERALAGVMLDLLSLRVETAPFGGRPAAMQIVALVEKNQLYPAQLAIDFGLDPIGDMARTGGTPLPWPDLSARAGGTAKELKSKGFDKAHFLRADGRAVHEAGGSEAQELAFVIAAGLAYLRLLEDAGFALDEAQHRVSFLLAADADEFLTIAKFRALRKLWARIEEACDLTPRPAFVAAETAWRMMTVRDPYVNMLRATIAVTAAGVGGADAIGVLPFTMAHGLPDRFARRVARNLQLVLLEESNLYRVADPAAGSGGIEALTKQLAHSAWTLCQEIESAGGAAAALEQGLIQQKVAATHALRQVAIAKRRDALTGSSDYPNLGEAPVKAIDVARVTVTVMPAVMTFAALPSHRLAEPFERLRDKSDQILAKTGARPKVFLANLGKLSDFTARATFAKNFYEAGGIEAVGNDGFPDLAAMLEAFTISGIELACLCSSDKVYETEAAEAARALTAAGATVHLAGRPGEHEPAWKDAGVKAYIYVGCDVLSTLQAAHDSLGAA